MITSSNISVFEKSLEVYLAQAYPLLLPFIVSQSQIQGGIVGALITLGGIIGCMVLPSLSDKLNRRKPFMVVSMLTIAPLIYMTGTSSGTTAATAAFTLGFFLLARLPISFQMAMETREIGPKLAGLAVGGLYTFGNLGGAVGPLVMEFFEESSAPYALSQLYYWQCYIATVSQAWWLSMVPTAPLAFPGSFVTATIVTVIVGVATFIATLLLKEAHAEAQKTAD